MCDAFKQSTDGTKIHDFSTIKNDLMIMDPSKFATKWFFDRCPFIFEDNEEEYIRWRHLISQNIDVDPTDIIVTGSASLGVSFNPNKNFKFFDASSDIDICIFSEYYFNVGWHDLRNYPRYGLTSQMQSAIRDISMRYRNCLTISILDLWLRKIAGFKLVFLI